MIDRVLAAIVRMADSYAVSAKSANEQPLQQTKTLTRQSRVDLTVGSMRHQALAIGNELILSDIVGMMVRNGNPHWSCGIRRKCVRISPVGKFCLQDWYRP